MVNSRYHMKNMGLAYVILGIKIIKTSYGLILSQPLSMDKILEKFSLTDSDIARKLLNVNLHLYKNKSDSVSQFEYSRVIKILMYLMSCTRPNITYMVSKLSKCTSNPRTDHQK